MRILLSAVFALVVLAVALPFLDALPVGELKPVSDPEPKRGSKSKASNPKSSVVSHPPGSLFRWRGPDGTIHIASDPPLNAVPVERFDYPGRGPSEGAAELDQAPGETKVDQGHHSSLPSLTSVPKERLKEILKRVEDTVGKLDERDQTLRSLKEQL